MIAVISEIETRLKKHGDALKITRACLCATRPRCEWIACDRFAEASYLTDPWPTQSERFVWACAQHFDIYDRHVNRKRYGRRIPGLDKPAGAGDDWRPNIMDMIRIAGMEANRQDRARQARELPPDAIAFFNDLPRIQRMTPAQRANLAHLREGTRLANPGATP